MKSYTAFFLIILTSLSCSDDPDFNGGQTLPEPDYQFSPPQWTIGSWIDETSGNSLKFEKDNILVRKGDSTTNFLKVLPDANEDFKTNSLYQLSVENDGIRIRFIFFLYSANTLQYTLKTMGSGPTIELIKR